MKKLLLLFLFSLFFISIAFTQSVGVGTASPHASAALEIKSNKQGVLPPRMSWQQVQAIPQPATGLLVFDTDIRALRMYDGNKWVVLSSGKDELNAAPGFSYSPVPITREINASAGIKSVAPGPDRSVYFGGTVSGGSVTIGGHTITNISTLWGDIFFGRADSTGTVLWLVSLNTNSALTNSGDAVNAMASDAAGNLYISGSFSLTVDFDPGPGNQSLTAATTNGCGYYAKYDLNGNWIWSKSFAGQSTVQNIITDGVSLFVTGSFYNTATFNPTSLTSAGGADIFLARYQCSDGNMGAGGWARRIGGTASEFASDLCFYTGSIIVCGSFTGTCNFGGVNRTAVGNTDGFFALYNPFGLLSNVYTIGGIGYDVVNSVEADAAGNVYCGGSFTDQADFDLSAGTSNAVSYGGRDAFVVKYDNAMALVNLHRVGGTSDDATLSLAMDTYGDVYALGYFYGDANFQPYRLSAYGVGSDLFLLKFPNNFTAEWVMQAGGAGSEFDGDFFMVPGTKNAIICAQPGDPFLDFNRRKQVGVIGLFWYYGQ